MDNLVTYLSDSVDGIEIYCTNIDDHDRNLFVKVNKKCNIAILSCVACV